MLPFLKIYVDSTCYAYPPCFVEVIMAWVGCHVVTTSDISLLN